MSAIRPDAARGPGANSAAAKAPLGIEMLALGEQFFVDPSATPAECKQLKQLYAEAKNHVAGQLSGLEGRQPLVIFCKSQASMLHFVGPQLRSKLIRPGHRVEGAGFQSPKDRPTIVVLGLGKDALGVLTHEWVHAEMLERMGGVVEPAWFHEGAATRIANTPDWQTQSGRGVASLRQLDRYPVWNHHTASPQNFRRTYAQAAAEVGAWHSQHGHAAFLRLMKLVGQGQPFFDVYGPMMTE